MMLIAAGCLWALGVLALWRVPRCRAGAPGPRPALSVIIPARNEERTLPRLLASLRAQRPPPEEVLVVDDGSTDATAAVARGGGARVLASAPLPEGWRGKTWACHQGAAAAAGTALLFVDADTWFEPDGLRRMVDTWRRHGGVLSVGAYHEVVRPYEELSAYFNLMMTLGVGAFTVRGAAVQPAGLFGPCLLLDRDTYARSGGHAAVRGRILEHYALAAVFRRQAVPMRCCGGRGVFHMRMYPGGVRDLVAGWSKAFASGAADTPLPLLLAAVGWLAGSLLAAQGVVVAAGGRAPLLAALAVYGLFAGRVGWGLRQIGSFRWWTALAYPVPLAFYLAVFARSAILAVRRSTVVWKGRGVPAGGGRESGGHAG